MRLKVFLPLLILTHSAAFAQIPGKGFPISPVKDQGEIGFCWANALSSFLEGRILNKSGKKVTLSANYLGLQYVYSSIVTELPALLRAANNTEQLIQETHLDSLTRIFKKRYDIYPEGQYLKDAIPLLKTVGAVPESAVEYYSFMSDTSDDQEAMDKQYSRFLRGNLTRSEQIKKYIANPHALLSDLAPILHITPIAPDENFTYEGKTYTPLTFMSDYLELEDDQLTSNEDADVSFDFFDLKIFDALQHHREVPISITLLAASDEDFYAQTSKGKLSLETCGNDCELVGAHSLSIVNAIYDEKGNHTGYLAKNSWGTNGQSNVKGQKATDSKSGGFLVLPLDYLKKTAFEIILEKN